MSMNKKVEFLKLLDAATRADGFQHRLEQKMQIVNLICQGDIKPEHALSLITIKIKDTNPTVVLLSLKVLDYCVKYCGSLMQKEIDTISYMKQLEAIIKITKYIEIKKTLLRLIQAWAHLFQNISSYSPVQEAVKNLKKEGYEFPAEEGRDTEESSARKNLRYCLRCQIFISPREREVYCTSCGKMFCIQCVFLTAPLPEFGNEALSVCEVCQGRILLSKAIDNINIIKNRLRVMNPSTDQHRQVRRQVPDPIVSTSNTREPEQESSECSVCFQREVDSILLLCGHACMCYQCSNEWKDKGNGCCPLCRTVIDEVLRISPLRANHHPMLNH